ncbi:MAG: prepilin-type N-terminal cleavage/methylation domain-containing protein [Pseudomonadota bacterium]
MTPQKSSGPRKKGFTLIELMIVVAIIAILAAIAIPMYGKYIKKSRTAEAVSNLGAIGLYEETYFSEMDRYVTADPDPASVPNPSLAGGRGTFSSGVTGWGQLGRAIPDGSKVFFQYEIRAGQITSGGGDGTASDGSLVPYGAGGAVAPGRSSCSPALTSYYAGLLSIPQTNSSNWFYATAVGDQDGDQKCSLFIKVIDRTDISATDEIE